MACVSFKGVSSKKEKGRETGKRETSHWSVGQRKGRICQTSAFSSASGGPSPWTCPTGTVSFSSGHAQPALCSLLLEVPSGGVGGDGVGVAHPLACYWVMLIAYLIDH